MAAGYVPSIDFFNALSGIGDTFAANRQEARDAELLGIKPETSGFVNRLLGTIAPETPKATVPTAAPQEAGAAPTPVGGEHLYNYLKSIGANNNEAALLTGEAAVESGFNPATIHDKGTGLGLWGHRLDRRDAMLAATGSQHPTAEQQADFALKELRSRPEHARVLAATTPQELADAGMFYERPQGFTEANPRGGLNYNDRLAAISRYAGGAPVQVADASRRVPASVGSAPAQAPTGLPPANDATVALLKTFPPGLQTPEGIARAMQAGSPHVRAIAERAFNVYTQALANQATREQHTAEFNLKRQDMLANQAARQQELDLRRQEREDTRSARQQELDLKRQERAEAGEKQTGEQANAATFATRMSEADKIISDPSIYGAGLGIQGGVREAAKNAPFVGNVLAGTGAKGEAFQKYDQARRDFVNAVLRKESGAAINAQEFANAERQYFPVPGDKPGTIEQKARNRATAIDTIAQGGTNTFRKEFAAKRAKSSGGPAVGAVEDGYRFKGGNPADPSAWERAQ